MFCVCLSVILLCFFCVFFFFFNDTATTEIYTLSLHHALPISRGSLARDARRGAGMTVRFRYRAATADGNVVERSEEHTSELQSPCNLVCRLLLEKKKNNTELPETRHIQTDQTSNHSVNHTSTG